MTENQTSDLHAEFNDSTLISELAKWNEGRGIDAVGWIECIGNYEQAIAYGKFFWPDFVIHDDCVFFAGFDESSYQGFLQQASGNKKSVEMVMNHRHISDLFLGATPTEAQTIYLGRLLRDIWQVKLNHDFPLRTIVVEFFEQDSQNLEDYEITFYQPSNDVSKPSS